MAGNGSASAGALTGLQDDHRLWTVAGSQNELSTLVLSETLDIETDDRCLPVLGQVTEEFELTDEGLVADAYRP